MAVATTGPSPRLAVHKVVSSASHEMSGAGATLGQPRKCGMVAQPGRSIGSRARRAEPPLARKLLSFAEKLDARRHRGDVRSRELAPTRGTGHPAPVDCLVP